MKTNKSAIGALLIILSLKCTAAINSQVKSANNPPKYPCQSLCKPEKLIECYKDLDKLSAEQKSFCTQMISICQDCPSEY